MRIYALLNNIVVILANNYSYNIKKSAKLRAGYTLPNRKSARTVTKNQQLLLQYDNSNQLQNNQANNNSAIVVHSGISSQQTGGVNSAHTANTAGGISSSTELALIRKGVNTKVPVPKWHAPWELSSVISGHLGWVRSIAFDPSNEWFATGSADRTIKVIF